MSSFGTGSTLTSSSSINLTPFEGTNGAQAGTDGLVPGPAVAQAGYLLGAGGDWTLDILGNIPLNESSDRIATTQFVQTLVANAQIPGGNANLSALGDVAIAGLADDQFLQYNQASGDWENISLTLSLISDVNLANLQIGQTIQWDGNEWIPGAGGGNVGVFNDLGDATVLNPANKHFLVHNGAGQFVNRTIDSSDLSDSANLFLADGSVIATGNLDVGDFDITNVGNVSLDSISADGTTISVNMTDNTASAFAVKEAGNNYIRVNTTNGSEQVVFDQSTVFNSAVDLQNSVTINEAGNGVDFRVETGTETHALFTDGGNDRVGIFQNNPTVPLDVVGNTKITGDLELVGAITANNLGTASASNVGDFLASNSSVDDLNDITLDGNETTDHFLVHNGAGQFVNRTINSSDLSDTGNISLLDANQTFTGDVRADTQGANDNSTLLATTAFVQQEITNASIADLSDVNTLANIQDGNVLAWVANNNRFEFTAPAQTYTDDNAQDAVNDMLNNNGAVHTNISFTYDDNANNMAVAVSLASTDLTDSNTLARLNSPTLTGVPLAPTANQGTNTTQLATTAFVQTEVTALNLGTASQSDAGDFLASNSSIDDLNDVTLGGALVNGKVLKVVAGVLTQADETGSTDEEIQDIVGLMLDHNNHSTGISFTYDDANGEVDSTLSQNLQDISALNVGDGNFIVGDGNNFTVESGAVARASLGLGTASQNDTGDFLASNSSVGDLNDVTLGVLAQNQVLKYTGNNVFENVSLASSDLSNSANISLLDANQTLTGDKVFEGSVEFDTDGNGTYTVKTPALQADNKEIANTEWVRDVVGAVGNVGELDDLNDVTIGGVALAQNQVLKYTGNNVFENVALASTDLSDNASLITTSSSIDSLSDVDTTNKADGKVLKFNAQGNLVVSDDSSRTDEEVQDLVGGMLNDGGGLTWTYDDANAQISAVVDVQNLSVGDHSDITLDGNEANKHFLVHNGAGQFVNRTVASSDLSDTNNIALLDANQTFAGSVNVTTQNQGDDSTLIASTEFVQAEITALSLGTASQNDTGDFLASNAGLNDLSNVTIGGVALAQNQVLKYTGNNVFENVAFASTDLSDSATLIKTTSSINSLNDVDTTNKASGKILKFNAQGNLVVGDDTSQTDEEIQDLVGAMVTDGGGLTWTYDDGNAQISAVVDVQSLSVGDHSDITLDGNQTTRHMLVHNGAGQFVNRTIAVADLSDNNTVLLTSGNQTITDQKDFTGGTLLASTQVASDSSTKVATTAFVQQEISGTNLSELNDLTIANPVNRETLVYNNGSFINDSLASGDLSDSANVALLDANQNFTGNIDFQGDTTADTQNASDNSTKVATTAYVDNQIDTDISNTSVGSLSDVTLGGVAKNEGQVLRISNDNSTFVNVQLSYNDLSNTPTLGTSSSKDAGTGADEVLLLTQATTLPALDGSNLTALGSIDLLSDVDTTTNAPQNNQTLLWDGNNFVPGDRTSYSDEEARDAVGTALNGGTHTGATTITFTNNDNADTIDLTLEVETANLTDVSSDAPTNTQVLRFTTDAGDNQNKYVPTTLGTASDVNTGSDSGNVPVISDHYFANGVNEKGDLLIFGRYVEVIDYGSVADAFNANNHFSIDFGAITDTVIYANEDYGVLVC